MNKAAIINICANILHSCPGNISDLSNQEFDENNN
jgi:hypothetical protein